MHKGRLSHHKQDCLLQSFVSGYPTVAAAASCDVNCKTAAYFFLRLRKIIAFELSAERDALFGKEVALDPQSYQTRQKGNPARGVGGLMPLVGLLSHGKNIHAVFVPQHDGPSAEVGQANLVVPSSMIFADHGAKTSSLDIGNLHHYHVNHSVHLADALTHINGVENFWSQATLFFKKFNGVSKSQFELYLREFEWRFSKRGSGDLSKSMTQWVTKHLR